MQKHFELGCSKSECCSGRVHIKKLKIKLALHLVNVLNYCPKNNYHAPDF